MEGGHVGPKRMRCRTTIDHLLTASICHAVIGREMELGCGGECAGGLEVAASRREGAAGGRRLDR